MSVVIETTVGDITIDLYLNDRPRASLNFLKLCKLKYYNYNLFHTISRGFIAQTGDPTGSRIGGMSLYGLLDGHKKRYFEAENEPRIKHTKMGLISFVGNEDNMIGSQFFFTLGQDLTYLDNKHCVFGEIVEGMDVLEEMNEIICDHNDCPYQDVRITHTVILSDPFPDPRRLTIPARSPSPSAELLKGGRIAPDETIDETEGKTAEEISEQQAEREAKARATILEMVGDLPDADMAPPENVLFVCKLNPVTSDDDLEIIFNRFGKIVSCEVIRDRKTGDSLQYAFIEFAERKSCEDAYFKMDNILIDDRRIHVDFSQSVSKVKWLGKGRGVAHFDEKGRTTSQFNIDIGKGNYKTQQYIHKTSAKTNTYNQSLSKSYHNRYKEASDNSRTPTTYSKENSSRDNQINYRFPRRGEDTRNRKQIGRDKRHRSRSGTRNDDRTKSTNSERTTGSRLRDNKDRKKDRRKSDSNNTSKNRTPKRQDDDHRSKKNNPAPSKRKYKDNYSESSSENDSNKKRWNCVTQKNRRYEGTFKEKKEQSSYFYRDSSGSEYVKRRNNKTVKRKRMTKRHSTESSSTSSSEDNKKKNL